MFSSGLGVSKLHITTGWGEKEKRYVEENNMKKEIAINSVV